ncbi:Ribosomal protein L13, eukaryotic/archaeal [mine drainage metagenome]|uniref:Ribosomal protein L13, eukaryotic/archaeal n=1 Tax=mine drainage metagenome TaxID=410659 RepID=T1ADF7_9ZZZZ
MPEVPEPEDPMVIDASGLVLGRAASLIAKRLLQGQKVIVINAEKSVVTGSRSEVLAHYTAARARGSVRSGPHYPRYPDRIFRRTVRGMLPHRKSHGRTAFERLEVHMGVPDELRSASPVSLDRARPRPSLEAALTLEDIARLLGARLL